MHEGRSAPVDFAVVEFPLGHEPLPADLAIELASLADAELIHLLDVVVVEKHADGTLEPIEVGDMADLGDPVGLAGRLHDVLAPAEVERLARAVRPGSTAVLVVWENTWAEPFVSLARACGGQVVADGRITSTDLGRGDAPDRR